MDTIKSTIGRFQERGKQNLPRQRGDQRKSKKELVVNNMEKIIGKPELFIHMGADWNQVEKITVGQTVKKVGNKTKGGSKNKDTRLVI